MEHMQMKAHANVYKSVTVPNMGIILPICVWMNALGIHPIMET